MNFYSLKIIFFIFFCGILFPQEDRVVAKVGTYKIYESEFKDRFDFSAHPKLLQKSDQLKAKEEFLNQLIAEKLLSLDAREKGFNQSKNFKEIISPLRNMYVRDALYNSEIKNKINYSQKYITEGIERIKSLLKVKFIYSDKKVELQNIFDKLNSGSSFDSILALRTESKDNPKEITFGTLDKDIEDIVYNLKIGEYTKPIESGDGFYILKLENFDPNPELKDQKTHYEDVKKIVETRAEYKRYLDYYHNFFKDYRITANKEIFENLIKIFIPELRDKYSDSNNTNNIAAAEQSPNKIYLRGIEITSALQKLEPESINNIFIDLKPNPVKVDEFINQLGQDGFYVKDLSELSIRSSLSSYVRKFIEDQLLTVEGVKKGFENSDEVKKYMKMWEDTYLSKMLMESIFDSIKVSEEDAYSVYKQNDWKDEPLELVNVAEVLTDSLKVVEKVLDELSKGTDIKELAKKYTIRDSLRNRGGEFGLFPITENGEIGRLAAQMKIGDVYGPLKLDEGYSVFQLIDKKVDTTSYSKSYSDVKKEILMKLTLAKFEKYVNEYNAMLAIKYGVEINEDVLKSIDNLYLNLVVVRYMGFGGEIFAVPYTEQYPGWYDIWQKNKNVIQ